MSTIQIFDAAGNLVAVLQAESPTIVACNGHVLVSETLRPAQFQAVAHALRETIGAEAAAPLRDANGHEPGSMFFRPDFARRQEGATRRSVLPTAQSRGEADA